MTKGGEPHDLWVFAYGSLMWRPGFSFCEVTKARVVGYSRRFCVTSVHHRGSARRPGLVLGLDRGGSCEGLAYRVPGERVAQTLEYLREREQVNGVYREVRVEVRLEEAARAPVLAVAYLVERAHPSYAGRLCLARQAQLICGARGISGVNLDYLVNTCRHMRELGIRDRELERLLTVIGGVFSRCRVTPCRPCSGTGPASARVEALCRASRCRPIPKCVVKRMKPGERRRFLHRRHLAP